MEHRDNTRVAEADEKLLTFDVSDDSLEGAAPVVGGQATVTLVYGRSLSTIAAARSKKTKPDRIFRDGTRA